MDIVEGWTEPLDFDLLINKPPVTWDATGTTVEASLTDNAGTPVSVGTAAWLDAAHSQVRYTPTGTEFTVARSPMQLRFKVTASGKVAYWPNGLPMAVSVRK